METTGTILPGQSTFFHSHHIFFGLNYRFALPSARGFRRLNRTVRGGMRSPGGIPSWRNHKRLELSVVNATLGTIRKVNYSTTFRRHIVDMTWKEVLSGMVALDRIALKNDLVRWEKNGPDFHYG
jgi:hypothetical protein